MAEYASNDEFKGSVNETLRQATAATGVSGTLQALAGADWVDVPDGALVGPTNITFYQPRGQVMRFASVTGGKIYVSG